ncbi:MAG: CRTAC1 family protein, partial [Chloroflexi bacterium]|nr:CRTAC1 family protein [Chloroflexota bacterium]
VGPAGSNYYGCVWADYDNDGHPDLFVLRHGGSGLLYHNNGNGAFAEVGGDTLANNGAYAHGCAWGDYDQDGFIDLFVTNYEHNFLLRNNGYGKLAEIRDGVLTIGSSDPIGCVWGDYDNDGDLDLFVATHTGNDLLYQNLGQGAFAAVTADKFPSASDDSHGCAWGDYNNDGFLDLFVANAGQDFLYRNNRDGSFTRITEGPVVTDGASSSGCAWADYDNDGFLDLFVATAKNDLLYRNNGDGSFAKITEGSLVNDSAVSQGCAWADYDNDGFLDLFVSNSGDNHLYRNSGNSNNWIAIKCVGTLSNRPAIGAKVRVKAVIGGTVQWQVRGISGGSGLSSQNDLRASFGLSDATNIDLIRIEWPSGVVQELRDVAVRQFLTVTEPSRLETLAVLNNQFRLRVNGAVGLKYIVEGSTDLLLWQTLAAFTNLNRVSTWRDPESAGFKQRFYRVIGP